MKKLIPYVIKDIVRSWMVIAYTLLLLAASFGLFSLGGDESKGLIGILSLVIFIVPLVSLIFGTIHLYNSYEFIELLSAQPLRRRSILLAEFIGVAASLGTAFLIGCGMPILLYASSMTGLTLIGVGLALTLIFIALAFLCALITRDKARGIGLAIVVWFYFAILHDGLMLFILSAFQDYPLETATVAMLSLNPIDLGRVIVLLQMDVSALMGQMGALMKALIGSARGILGGSVILLLWLILPLAFSARLFHRRDL